MNKLLLTLSIFAAPWLMAQNSGQIIKIGKPQPENLSLRNEVERAIDKGTAWLVTQQTPEGYWGDPKYPALTGLAVSSLLNNPEVDTKSDAAIQKGLKFIVTNVQADGGIYGKGLGSYNTSLCMMALMQSGDRSYEPVIRKARRFLINQQADYDLRGTSDNTFDGGVGYGSTYSHSDLSNTHLAMEALYYSEIYLKKTPETDLGMDLNWEMAIEFVSRCQNRPASNKEEWAQNAKKEDVGGFIYFPGKSMSGEEKLANGKIALRSYGSMSYAGLLSFIYAKMDPTDPRVQSAREWLGKNYTIKENPGMGPQGLYYYYHTMGKALTLLGEKTLVLENGQKVDWRMEMIKELFNNQGPKGFWLNENGRWWEKDPVLVTSYALLTLERLHSTL